MAGDSCPTVSHAPQLWPRRTTFGTNTTPRVELFPGSASPSFHLSVQLMETTRHREMRSKCPTSPDCCPVFLNLRPAGTAFRKSVKHNQEGKCMVNRLKFRIGRSTTTLKNAQGPTGWTAIMRWQRCLNSLHQERKWSRHERLFEALPFTQQTSQGGFFFQLQESVWVSTSLAGALYSQSLPR